MCNKCVWTWSCRSLFLSRSNIFLETSYCLQYFALHRWSAYKLQMARVLSFRMWHNLAPKERYRRFGCKFCHHLQGRNIGLKEMYIRRAWPGARALGELRSKQWTVSFDAFVSPFRDYVPTVRRPLWSSGQSSWLQIRRPGFDSRHFQKKKLWVWNGVHSASWVQLRRYLIEK
jgi:hypothetical protein